MTSVIVIYGGELAKDVAEQIKAQAPPGITSVTLQSASERPKKLLEDEATAVAVWCFVLQTVENGDPTEDGGVTTRFFKRKSHPADLLTGRRFAVLGLGDSNLLLDRQTTTAKDCNQVAQEFDSRLEDLGATRQCSLGMADERTDLTEVDPWIVEFWNSIFK